MLVLLLVPVMIGGSQHTGPAIFSNEKWVALDNLPQSVYPPPSTDSWRQPTTEIYISIADFLDSVRCAQTVHNYVSKAKYPDRLKFGRGCHRVKHVINHPICNAGIIEQIEVEDNKKVNNCLVEYAKLTNKSPQALGIKAKHVEYSRRQARGAAYARIQDDEFMETEDFCLSSDAHMDVVQVKTVIFCLYMCCILCACPCGRAGLG